MRILPNARAKLSQQPPRRQRPSRQRPRQRNCRRGSRPGSSTGRRTTCPLRSKQGQQPLCPSLRRRV
jgi:hypothetical protein